MQLTEHLQYIIHSAKTIAYARDYDFVEPEHVMLALFMDENDLPKFLLEKIGLNNPRLIRDFNDSIQRKSHHHVKSQDIPLSKKTLKILEKAEKEGLARQDEIIGLEYVFLALFSTENQIMENVFGAYFITLDSLYSKMLDVVKSIERVDIVDGKAVKQQKNKSTSDEEKITVSQSSSPDEYFDEKDINPTKKHSTENNESALSKYTTDLTKIAALKQLDPVIGRDDEIRRVIQILNRRSKNNPVIVGEPGVGKTAVIEGLAQRIISGEVPDSLKNDKILALDLGALLAGASYRGEFEDRLKKVLKEIEEKTDDLMLFIDEIHNGHGSF